jgi:hypothetical protein
MGAAAGSLRITTLAGAAIDRVVLRAMERLWLSGGDPTTDEARDAQLRAFDIYTCETLRSDPLSFFPTPPLPRIRVKKVNKRLERWTWESGYQTWHREFQPTFDRFEANRTAHAELHTHGRPGTPTIVCLHSWVIGSYSLQRWVFMVHRLYKLGFDVALVMLPFHGLRSPREAAFGGQLFPGVSPQHTNEGFGQLIWDVRSLIAHLVARGSGPLGAMGMSLGGYSTALLASVEPQLHFAIPMIPMASFADLIWHHGRNSPIRKIVESRGATLERLRAVNEVHSPLMHRPLVPWDRRMIIAGAGDRVCEPTHVRRLWDHWERPEIHWFPGSHIVHFGRGSVFRAVKKFLKSRVLRHR